MLNLIDMNLTRFFKTKALYVTSIITFLMLFLLTFSIGEMDFNSSCDQLAMGLTLSMVGIFSAVYSDEERKSGFLKNLETSRAKKGNVFLSKIPVVALYSFIIILVAMVAIIAGLIKNPASFAGMNVLAVVAFLGVQTLIHTAFGVGFLAIYEISRGTIAPIVLSLMFGGGTHILIINALTNKLVQVVPALGPIFEKVSPNYFQVVSMSKEVSVAGGCKYIGPMIIGIILLTVYSMIGTKIFRKRDTF
ncbi:MAG: ABC transporter permease [Butyrivibrio sp.]|nr:ABC transporter permease [Butyrivibrio sp.]